MSGYCVRCKGKRVVREVFKYTADQPEHTHVKCESCGYEFNEWGCGLDELKKVFGGAWHLYTYLRK